MYFASTGHGQAMAICNSFRSYCTPQCIYVLLIVKQGNGTRVRVEFDCSKGAS